MASKKCDKCGINAFSCLCTPLENPFTRKCIGPKKSLAWGCTPSQVAKANAEAERRGVRAPYKPDGTCVFDSPGHEKKYYEAFGAYDKEGGYDAPKRGVAFERGWEVQEKD